MLRESNKSAIVYTQGYVCKLKSCLTILPIKNADKDLKYKLKHFLKIDKTKLFSLLIRHDKITE